MKSHLLGNGVYVFSSIVFGTSMILLYTVSSLYHGLRHVGAKKVFQIIDHCTIYFLIAGTYTPMVLCAIARVDADVAYLIFFLEWALVALCTTLTAIDLKKFKTFSMACYIIMGWAVLIAIDKAYMALGSVGFALLLGGGIAYTVGFVFYKIGKKKKYFHSIFHLLVLLGSITQGLSVLLYAIR
jgi:hemolysin III